MNSGITPSYTDTPSLTPRSDGAPIYDAAYLSELKASTPTNRPPASRNDSYDVDMSVDPDDYPMTTIDDVSGMIVILCHKASAVFSVAEDLEPVIPSESSILASKRERNRATLSTGRDDYISLTVAKQDDEYRGPHPESRLMREEDELGEGEDGQWIFSRRSVTLV